MVNPANFLEFRSCVQWRDWLEKNHTIETEAWLIIYRKKYEELGLSLNSAIEEALCFGWIDGILRRIDERRYGLRFSPRATRSVWSISNINRVEKLIKEGKMAASGMLKIIEAKEKGAWAAARQREQMDIIPKELENALVKEKGALSLYRKLPDSRKKQYIYWLENAKREETKQKRIRKIITEILAQ